MNYKLSTSILAADVARLGEELDTVIKAGIISTLILWMECLSIIFRSGSL